MTSTLTRAVVEATFDDVIWAAALNDLGPERAMTILKGVHRDIGLQITERSDRLANTRDSDDVDDTKYNAARIDYRDWHRRAIATRRVIQRRIAEVRPLVNDLHDRHQADRRALLRLAKRLWLHEHGLESQLDTALDDLDCSSGDNGRISLREVVERLAENAVVLP